MFRTACFAFAVLLVSPIALAQVRTYAASAARDNTLYQEPTGALSNGAGEFFFAGTAGGGTIRRGLIAFDLSGLPNAALIVDVTLRLNMSRTSTAATNSVTLHRTLADWGEGASDAPGEEGGGATSTPGDATWLHRFFNTDLWTTNGGDFAATASASQNIGGIGTYEWTTAEMASDVQEWSLNRSQNFGWTLRGDESAAATAKRFDSRQNLNLSVRPVLIINYFLRCPWDLDNNGMINLEDLAALLAHFGTVTGATPMDGDIDGDGDVDLSDLATELSWFGLDCPP